MKILEEASQPMAWCVDTKGKVYPVYVHPYGALDDSAIEDAAWLYCAAGRTDDSYIKYIANEIIDEYLVSNAEEALDTIQEAKTTLLDTESLKQYSNLSTLVSKVTSYIKEYAHELDDRDNAEHWLLGSELSDLGNSIKQELNNNFMRVRLGSEYQTHTERRGALYFRISSTNGFDWYKIVEKFVVDLSASRTILTITIESDQSSTGKRVVYVNHMPLNDFLMKKKFVVESLQPLVDTIQ